MFPVLPRLEFALFHAFSVIRRPERSAFLVACHVGHRVACERVFRGFAVAAFEVVGPFAFAFIRLLGGVAEPEWEAAAEEL